MTEAQNIEINFADGYVKSIKSLASAREWVDEEIKAWQVLKDHADELIKERIHQQYGRAMNHVNTACNNVNKL